MSIVVFLIGLLLSLSPIYKAKAIENECNAHWKKQFDNYQKKDPDFTAALNFKVPINFSQKGG